MSAQDIVINVTYQTLMGTMVGVLTESMFPKFDKDETNLRLLAETITQSSLTAYIAYQTANFIEYKNDDPTGGVIYFIVMIQAQQTLQQRLLEVGQRMKHALKELVLGTI